MPKLVTSGAGLVLPPGVVTPPPPFPISGVICQPLPLFYVCLENDCMGLPKVRIDLFLQPPDLLLDHLSQRLLSKRNKGLALSHVNIDLGNRHYSLTRRAFGLEFYRLLTQLL